MFFPVVPQHCFCGSEDELPLQREAVRHVPGLWGQWFDPVPNSQMVGSFNPPFSLAQSVPLAHKPSSLLALSLSFTDSLTHAGVLSPPRLDEDISSGKQRVKRVGFEKKMKSPKNVFFCARYGCEWVSNMLLERGCVRGVK